MPVLAGVGEGGIPGPGDGVHAGPGLEQVADQLEVTLLAGLHQGGRGPELQVRPGLDQEDSHLKEAATAGQGQGRLLGLLSLSVDVSSLGKQTSNMWNEIANE